MTRPFRFSVSLGAVSDPHQLVAAAQRAEALGYDSITLPDHLDEQVGPLVGLAAAAAATDRLTLTTLVLANDYRHPAVLAKEIATLHYLSGNRYIYGVGTGWYGPEFTACGVDKSERGARTDEVLEATMAMFSGEPVEHHGRYYDLDGVAVEPRLDPPPPVWAAGGSQLVHDSSPERPAMHPNVLRRIVHSNGWIARPTCPPELIASDLEVYVEALERGWEENVLKR